MVLGVALFTSLGVWQLHRRVWKLDLMHRVDARVHAPPVAAPGPSEWRRVDRARDEYRRVAVTGHYLNDRETLVRAVTALGGGYWVLTPFETTGGFTVLVNRGFVPPGRRDPKTRTAGAIGGETTIVGLMRMTEPKGAFLHTNDPPANRWYSRDVAAISAARHLEDTAPYFIDADDEPVPGGYPVGGLTVIAFPNNHLVYALTWFGLALLLAGALIYVGKDEWAHRRRL
jgi:surfeit locus 1 family protein